MPLISENYPQLPLWAMTILLFLALIVAREIGARLCTLHADDTNAGSDGFAMTTVLGLLALLIGFTFSIALQRYDSRRALVVQEANAIGTTWLRTALLEPGDRGRVQAVLRSYTESRILFGDARNGDEELQLQKKSLAIQTELWEAMIVATSSFKDTARAALLLNATNESIDLAEERLANRQAHVPPRILWMLVIFAVLAAGLVGFERPRQRRTSALVLGLFTLAAALVVDLDRPATGLTRVSQAPMLDLLQSMHPTL